MSAAPAAEIHRDPDAVKELFSILNEAIERQDETAVDILLGG